MLPRRDNFEAVVRDFRWDVPARFNIGVAACDAWAEREPNRAALIEYNGGEPVIHSYGELRDRSNRLAHGLRRLGVKRGDRVALLVPQGLDALTGHIAIYKLGAIAVPLALLFGREALGFRLRFAGVSVVIANAKGAENVALIEGGLPDLRCLIETEPSAVATSVSDEWRRISLRDLIDGESASFDPVDTGPDDPALMIFTSGTTGPPKGALHGHRVLLGHLPGFEMAYQFPPQPGDVMWTPADWAWAGGLLNALLPALTLGIPAAFGRFERFSPRGALELMADLKVTIAFLPPTALRMLKNSGLNPREFPLSLRAVMSAGEQLGRETYDWSRDAFGFAVNEMYGQTECNLVLGSCALLGVSRPGPIGRVVPGHRVAIVDGQGHELERGISGQIAVHRPDPVMFLGYWQDADATAAKFVGDWMMTGDQGTMDAAGYVTFVGRDDDVITSAGYRIGPGEIEDCLAAHPAVEIAAAVGKPDPVRTEIVKAYVVLRDGFAGDAALAEEIKLWVRERLSAHEYPREVEFVDEVPLTTTGKVIRRFFRDRARTEATINA
jgi:acetyl-CoA synthetase